MPVASKLSLWGALLPAALALPASPVLKSHVNVEPATIVAHYREVTLPTASLTSTESLRMRRPFSVASTDAPSTEDSTVSDESLFVEIPKAPHEIGNAHIRQGDEARTVAAELGTARLAHETATATSSVDSGYKSPRGTMTYKYPASYIAEAGQPEWPHHMYDHKAYEKYKKVIKFLEDKSLDEIKAGVREQMNEQGGIEQVEPTLAVLDSMNKDELLHALRFTLLRLLTPVRDEKIWIDQLASEAGFKEYQRSVYSTFGGKMYDHDGGEGHLGTGGKPNLSSIIPCPQDPPLCHCYASILFPLVLETCRNC